MHLRHAAQRVRVLDPRVAVTVRLADRAALEQRPQPPRALGLALVRAHRLDFLVERSGRSLEPLERHGARHLEGLQRALGIEQREHAQRGTELRAVDEGEAVFFAHVERGDARLLQGCGGVGDLPARFDLALAHHTQRDVGERDEVAARANRAVLGHHRMDAVVQALEQHLDAAHRAARMAVGEGVGPEQHQRAHPFAAHRIAESGGVAAHDVHLERHALIGRNHDLGEPAESRRHAVDVLASREVLLDHRTRGLERLLALGRERHFALLEGRDAAHVLERQRTAVDREHVSPPSWGVRSSACRP